MKARGPRYAASLKRRPARELLAYVYRPLGYLLVRALWNTAVRPEHLVLLHGLLGLAAAALIALGAYPAAAVLLPLVILLDNADGQLARARGQTSLLGRYLDTEVDFLVHVALFTALADVCGAYAWLGMAALVLALSLDFNLSQPEPPAEQHLRAGLESLLAAVYELLFAWQDRAIRRLEGFLGGPPYWLRFSLANQGRSTQLLLLTLALLYKRPCVYVVYLLILTAGLVLVYAVRIWRRLRVFPSPR